MTNWNPDVHCCICNKYLHSLYAYEYEVEDLIDKTCGKPECQQEFTLKVLRKKKVKHEKA